MTLGDTGTKTNGWIMKKKREKKGNNNRATSAWIDRTALNPAIGPTGKLPPTTTVTSTTMIMTNSVADLKPSIHKLIQVITDDSNMKIYCDSVIAVAFQ